jgi:hypothetical protein
LERYVNRLRTRPGKRIWIFVPVVLAVLVFGTDWLLARNRLDGIDIVMRAEPENVVANGKDKSTLTIRFTENGQPRANDLIQLWLAKGGGLLIPNWVYTDSDGTITVTYTPNPYSRYDPQDGAEIVVLDTSIGRLIEVGKQSSIRVGLVKPEN